MNRVVVWFGILVLCLLPALTASRLPPLAASDQAQIVFHSDPEGGSDFYLMNADGSGLLRLTENFNVEPFATVSPDGRWLAFASRGHRDLFLLDLEAVQQDPDVMPINLTRSAQSDFGSAWSPDSRRLAFSSDDTIHIYLLDLSSGDRSEADSIFDRQSPGFQPVWSPDGIHLAFFSDRDGNAEIYLMEAAGSGQTRLTDDLAADYSPGWSPDGQHLVFISERDGNAEVYIMNADGSGVLNVSNDSAHDEFATWSPDGTEIVYVSYQDNADPFSIGVGNAEIFVVNPDGSGKANLTANDVWDGDPAWSPDGEWIVFTRRVGEEHQGHIYVMRADGSQQTRLVGEPGEWNDCCAVWRP